MLEIVPLVCPQCCSVSPRSLVWVHQNSRVTCDRCGTGFPIDKDRLALWLADQERQEEESDGATTPPAT